MEHAPNCAKLAVASALTRLVCCKLDRKAEKQKDDWAPVVGNLAEVAGCHRRRNGKLGNI